MRQSTGRDEGQVNRLARLCHDTERLNLIVQKIASLLVDDIESARILHLANIHNIVSPVNQKVYLSPNRISLVCLMPPRTYAAMLSLRRGDSPRPPIDYYINATISISFDPYAGKRQKKKNPKFNLGSHTSLSGARGGTRTRKDLSTCTSSMRVCQFHHPSRSGGL